VLNVTFRPLDKWPGEPTLPALRKYSPFKATFSGTLDLLELELAQLAATARTWADAATREAQKLLHPDAGGSHEEFVRLQQAAAIIAEHFKSKDKSESRRGQQ